MPDARCSHALWKTRLKVLHFLVGKKSQCGNDIYALRHFPKAKNQMVINGTQKVPSTSRTKYWVSLGWRCAWSIIYVANVYRGRGCLDGGRADACCITANSASMETLCPASSLPPPHVRSRNCSKFQNLHHLILEPLSIFYQKRRPTNLWVIKSVKYQFWQLVQIQISSTEFQISFTVAKSVHIWWWIDQIDHRVTFQEEPLFNWTIRSHTKTYCILERVFAIVIAWKRAVFGCDYDGAV